MNRTNEILTKEAKLRMKDFFSGIRRIGDDAAKYIHPVKPKVKGLGEFAKRHKFLTIGAGALALGAGDVVKEVIVDPAKLKADQMRAFKEMESKVPSLEGIDRSKKKDYFKVISLYAPSLSRNPYVAGNLVNKFNEYGGPDHKIVQDIINMEKGIESKKGTLDKIISRAAGVVAGIV